MAFLDKYFGTTTIDTGGGSGAVQVADRAALQAVTPEPATGAQYLVGSDPVPWSYDRTSGAGFAADGQTLDKLTSVALGSNGRFYRTTSSPVLTTIAALRLAVAGVHSSIQVQAYATLGDGGGRTVDLDPNDATSPDDGGKVFVAGSRRYKSRHTGKIPIPYFGGMTRSHVVIVVPATDLFTSVDPHDLAVLQPVNVSDIDNGGALPAPLVRNVTYYVSATGLTATAFKLSATSGGSVIDITTTGSGKLVVSTVASRAANTATVSAAVTACLKGGALSLPAGIWPLTVSSLYWLGAVGVSIEGDGKFTSQFFDPRAYSASDAAPGDSPDAFLTFADPVDVHIRRIGFIGAANYVAQVALGTTVTSRKAVYFAYHAVGSKNCSVTECLLRRIEGECLFGDGAFVDVHFDDNQFDEVVSNGVNWGGGATVLRCTGDRNTFNAIGQSTYQGGGNDCTFNDNTITAHATQNSVGTLILLEAADGFQCLGTTIRGFTFTTAISLVQIGNLNGPVRNSEIDIALIGCFIITDSLSANSLVNLSANHGDLTDIKLTVRASNCGGTKNGGVISLVRCTGTGLIRAEICPGNVANGTTGNLDAVVHIDSTVPASNQIRVRKQAAGQDLPTPYVFNVAPMQDNASVLSTSGASDTLRINAILFKLEKLCLLVDDDFNVAALASATCVAFYDPAKNVTLSANMIPTGVSPPAVTLSGTLTQSVAVLVKIRTGGVRGVATVDISIDGGATMIATNVLTAATVAVGSTGIVLNFPSATYAAATWAAAVASWGDISASAATLAQGTASLQPAILSQWRNGRPGISYDGVDDRLYGANANILTGCVLYAVIQCDPAVASKIMFDGSAASKMATYAIDANHYAIESSGAGTNTLTSSALATPTKPHILKVRYGASALIQEDLVLLALSGGTSSGTANPAGLNIGGQKGGGLDCKFVHGLIALFNGPLSAADEDRLITSWKAKYL